MVDLEKLQEGKLPKWDWIRKVVTQRKSVLSF
jgi:hypothetical protein